MFVCNLLGGVRDRRFVVEIEPQGLDRNATRGELCHGTLAALRITCAEDNVHTRIAELLRDLPSNSFISACDKRDAGRVGHDFSLIKTSFRLSRSRCNAFSGPPNCWSLPPSIRPPMSTGTKPVSSRARASLCFASPSSPERNRTDLGFLFE